MVYWHTVDLFEHFLQVRNRDPVFFCQLRKGDIPLPVCQKVIPEMVCQFGLFGRTVQVRSFLLRNAAQQHQQLHHLEPQEPEIHVGRIFVQFPENVLTAGSCRTEHEPSVSQKILLQYRKIHRKARCVLLKPVLSGCWINFQTQPFVTAQREP